MTLNQVGNLRSGFAQPLPGVFGSGAHVTQSKIEGQPQIQNIGEQTVEKLHFELTLFMLDLSSKLFNLNWIVHLNIRVD